MMTLMSGATSAVDRICARVVATATRTGRGGGAVNRSNGREFLDAGAIAVGVGAVLTDAAHVESEARRLAAAVSTV
jgi:hypothetical protein